MNCKECHTNRYGYASTSTTADFGKFEQYINKEMKQKEEFLSSQSKPSNPTIMYQLTNIAKRLLNKEVKTLVKAGFMNSELSMTEAGRQELTSILFDKFQKELVEAAAAKLEEDKENQ